MTRSGEQLRLGFVAVMRSTFDVPLAESMVRDARARLAEGGFDLAGPAGAVSTVEEAGAAAKELAGEPIDALVVFQATFADSGMARALAEGSDAPLLLWAIPEKPSGGRLRLNSYCGVNLGAHALRRAGLRYEALYLDAADPEAVERIRTLARAGRIRRRLRGTRIGRFGPEPDGFASCVMDAEALRERLGVEVAQYELASLFDDVKRMDGEEIDRLRNDLTGRIDGLREQDPEGVKGTLGTYLALRRLAEKEGLAGFAIRCWPEFFTGMQCAACGALSLLSDELTPASCESDVNGVITQLTLQEAAGAPVFDSDIVAVNEELDGVVFWHCGKAPLSMADPEERPLATVHSNRLMPLLMEFPLKPGPVTLARLSAATGGYRLVIGTGEMVRSAKSFTGTSGVCRFAKPAKAFMETILEEGLEHHVALAYGDHTATLRALARLLDLPVLEL